MKYIFPILALIISNDSLAITNTECRRHYIEIITVSPESELLTGSEQIDLFLQPSKIVGKFKTAKNDSVLQECIKNNNK